MTVSIPLDITNPWCSESSDIRTLDDLIVGGQSAPITKGMDIRDYGKITGDVWKYSLSKRINVENFNNNSTSHEIDDIVVRNGHHHIITEKEPIHSTKKVPKEPEDYTGNETDLRKFKTWTGRYFKSNYNFCMTTGGKSYTMFFNTCAGSCHRGRMWQVVDNTTGWHNRCLLTCMKNGYANRFKYSKDIKGIKKKWSGSYGTKEEIFIAKSYISRGDWCYVRTWTNAPIQYDTVITGTTYSYNTRRIWSPEEIDGFRWFSKTNCGSVFDDKNYTKGEFYPENEYVDFKFTTTGDTDTIALGRIICDSVSVTAYSNSTGDVIAAITDYPINTQLGDTNFSQATNVVLYVPIVLPNNTEVKVRLRGGNIDIGRLIVGKMLKLGFSNTIFTNGFKDHSPKEQDQWGNIEYRNGIRVFLYNGTVELPTKDYDALNLAFMYVGGQEMIINGSDSHANIPANSLDIFQSTMMIGRFVSFKPTTKNKGTIMSNVAGYSFSIAESV